MNRIIPLGLLLLSLTGCETAQKYSLTYKLWTNEDMSSFCEPAPNPHLALFDSEKCKDVFVQYDAVTEKNDKVSRRAYYLRRDNARICARKKPHFIDPAEARGMKPIPVLKSEPAADVSKSMAYAITDNSSRAFTLCRPGEATETYELPVFHDSTGTVTRTILSPFAVAGDTVMIGGVASVMALFAWASMWNVYSH